MKEGRLVMLCTGARSYDQPSEKVGRAVPAFLPPFPSDQPLNRLGLARWIVSENNPLTARVWVNREWERFFGTGLVKTREISVRNRSFPSTSSCSIGLPWNSCDRLRRPWAHFGGWPLGHEATSEDHHDESSLSEVVAGRRCQLSHRSREPALGSRSSHSFARGSPQGFGLFVSGLLIDKLGGPSVRPYMPEGVWDETSKYGNYATTNTIERKGSIVERFIPFGNARRPLPPCSFSMRPIARPAPSNGREPTLRCRHFLFSMKSPTWRQRSTLQPVCCEKEGRRSMIESTLDSDWRCRGRRLPARKGGPSPWSGERSRQI